MIEDEIFWGSNGAWDKYYELENYLMSLANMKSGLQQGQPDLDGKIERNIQMTLESICNAFGYKAKLEKE